MRSQHTSQFLNVDLVLLGRFDPTPLLAAAGKQVFALGEYGPVGAAGRSGLSLEVAAPGLDLPRTLRLLVRWVEHLPPTARRSWKAASRRVFDIGIQSGLGPQSSEWGIPASLVAAVAKVGGEIRVTVYGTNYGSDDTEAAPAPPRRAGPVGGARRRRATRA